jgi:hypothetical protein
MNFFEYLFDFCCCYNYPPKDEETYKQLNNGQRSSDNPILIHELYSGGRL